MSLVTRQFEEEGWTVESVERNKCGYDLVCTKEGRRKDVEVKGVRGTECKFIITAGELRQASSNPHFIICVVTEALLNAPKMSSYSGGRFLREFELNPISYWAVPR